MRKQSVTDHLANERTFLAYARTALAFIGFGFVIARFALFTREVAVVAHVRAASPTLSTGFGTMMAVAGMAWAAYGAYRYVETERALRAGGDAAMPNAIAIVISAAIALIGAVVMWALLAFR